MTSTRGSPSSGNPSHRGSKRDREGTDPTEPSTDTVRAKPVPPLQQLVEQYSIKVCKTPTITTRITHYRSVLDHVMPDPDDDGTVALWCGMCTHGKHDKHTNRGQCLKAIAEILATKLTE